MPKLAALILVLASVVASADDNPVVRTISVSGIGSVETPPDRASLSLSIVAREPTVAAAQERAAEVTAAVLALASDMDIPENRVDTMSATVRPNYRWNRDTDTQELLGYIASREMRIKLHDLDKVGTVVERAVEAGVNQVSAPQLSSSKARDAYRDALEKAAEDARLNAQRLAEALGLELGKAVQVGAGAPTQPPRPLRQMDEVAAMSAPAATYNAGDLTVSARISIVFEASQ
jgi:uncharacterized protein YggE